MSLDICITALVRQDVYSDNITHNLGKMAGQVIVSDTGITLYQVLWRPEDIGITNARQAHKYLKRGLKILKAEPNKYKTFNPENGWGTYEGLCDFVEDFLIACKQYPSGKILVSR